MSLKFYVYQTDTGETHILSLDDIAGGGLNLLVRIATWLTPRDQAILQLFCEGMNHCYDKDSLENAIRGIISLRSPKETGDQDPDE